MTIEKAKTQLEAHRQQQRELRKKIDTLREWLRKKGIDPDAPKTDFEKRNREMYGRYLDGLTWDEIAAEYKLSRERVKHICWRVEIALEKKAKHENK
ncbi:MAG: hypothetical protein EOO14_12780 [Chitinophagaceae bacterium]|nr:MAG: hypothetical protein EOO14_12780 [Chitinophagaceae bacterium]